MPLPRSEIIAKANVLARLSSDFQFRISKPANAKDISWRQKQLDRPIPAAITEFALQTASRVFLQWELDAGTVESDLFDEEFPASGSFEFNFFETDLSSIEGWEDSFTNWPDYRSEPNPFNYDEIFPIFDVGNGDILVTLIGQRDAGAIYYLDHEGGDGDWKRIADSYDQFLTTLSGLWFPNLEWYGSLLPFYDTARGRLSADTTLGRKFDGFIRNAQPDG